MSCCLQSVKIFDVIFSELFQDIVPLISYMAKKKHPIAPQKVDGELSKKKT